MKLDKSVERFRQLYTSLHIEANDGIVNSAECKKSKRVNASRDAINARALSRALFIDSIRMDRIRMRNYFNEFAASFSVSHAFDRTIACSARRMAAST